MLVVPLWCDLRCCSRTVVVIKFAATPAYTGFLNADIEIQMKLWLPLHFAAAPPLWHQPQAANYMIWLICTLLCLWAAWAHFRIERLPQFHLNFIHYDPGCFSYIMILAAAHTSWSWLLSARQPRRRPRALPPRGRGARIGSLLPQLPILQLASLASLLQSQLIRRHSSYCCCRASNRMCSD